MGRFFYTFSICAEDLLLFHQRVGNQLPAVEVCTVHVHRRNLAVFIGRVIIDPSVCITAGGVKRDLIFSLRDFTASSLLVYGAKDMEKLADALCLTFPGDRMHFGKCHFRETGC